MKRYERLNLKIKMVKNRNGPKEKSMWTTIETGLSVHVADPNLLRLRLCHCCYCCDLSREVLQLIATFLYFTIHNFLNLSFIFPFFLIFEHLVSQSINNNYY